LNRPVGDEDDSDTYTDSDDDDGSNAAVQASHGPRPSLGERGPLTSPKSHRKLYDTLSQDDGWSSTLHDPFLTAATDAATTDAAATDAAATDAVATDAVATDADKHAPAPAPMMPDAGSPLRDPSVGSDAASPLHDQSDGSNFAMCMSPLRGPSAGSDAAKQASPLMEDMVRDGDMDCDIGTSDVQLSISARMGSPEQPPAMQSDTDSEDVLITPAKAHSVHLQPRRREGARRTAGWIMVDMGILGAHSKLQPHVLIRVEGRRLLLRSY
jgi:hypothetical protein